MHKNLIECSSPRSHIRMYYSATIFSYVGFSNSTAVGLVISGTNFLFTLVALKYVDIIGRRKIIIWTIPGMIFGLVFASVCFSFMTRDTNERLVEGMVYSKTWSGLMLFAMIIFVACEWASSHMDRGLVCSRHSFPPT